jgi:hypothetical protein
VTMLHFFDLHFRNFRGDISTGLVVAGVTLSWH